MQRQPKSGAARARSAVVAIIASFHIAAMLVTGTHPVIRDALNPLFGWYSDGLRMTGRWGMFAKRPSSDVVVVVGVTEEGSRVDVATTVRSGEPLAARVYNGRLRKIQHKLRERPARAHWGDEYLLYWCRQHPGRFRDVRLEQRRADATAVIGVLPCPEAP